MSKREPFVIENFVLGMNNAPDAEDLFPNEMLNIRNMVTSKPGQLITVGKETAELKACTAYQPYPGANLFHMMLDRNLAKTELSTEWLLVGDEDTGNIGIVEYHATNQGQAAISGGTWNAAKIACGGGSGFIMSAYVFDGAIRVCDASFGGTPKWYGYIKRYRFTGAGGDAWTDDEYYEASTLLTPPAIFSLTSTAGAVNLDTGLATGAIQANFESSHLAAEYNYQWQKKLEGAVSYVYDGNQESLLTVSSNVLDLTVAAFDDIRWGSWGIHITGTEALLKAALNKRITHIKLYIKEQGTEDWYLQGVYDLDSGGMLPHSTFGKVWLHVNDGGNQYYYSRNAAATAATSWMPEPLMIYTYFTETGHRADIKVIDFGRATEGWKTACVVGKTVYLGYTRRENEDGNIVSNGDALWKSVEGQPDKFIPANMNIAVSDDGDNIVRVVAGSSVVYEYKEKVMRIIDVGSEDRIERIAATLTGDGGIEFTDKVIDTPFGPVWINRYGMFTFNEDGLVKLFERTSIDKSIRTTMDIDWWNTNIYDGGDCTLGYDPRLRQILVSNYGSFGSTTNNGIIFDMVSRSWVHIYNRLTHVASNMILDSRGNLVFLMDDATNGEVHVFDFDEATSDKIRIETGETHFKHGSGTYKYVYRVLIKYMHSHSTKLDNNVVMYRDGDAATFRLVGSMPQATSWKWAEYVMPSSAVFEKVDTCRLDIGGYDWTGSETDKDTKLRIAKIIYDKRHLPNYRVA